MLAVTGNAMKRLITAGASLALALLSGPALHAQPVVPTDEVLPGYWQYKTRVLGFIPAGTEHKCLNTAEIDKFFDSLCNRHHTCQYPVREIGGGKVRLEGYWQNKEGKRTPVRATGDYSTRLIKLRANAVVSGVSLGATLEAKWLNASCPMGAK